MLDWCLAKISEWVIGIHQGREHREREIFGGKG